MTLSLADALTTAVRPLAAPPEALRHPRVKFSAGEVSEVITGDVPVARTQDEYRDRIRESCEVDIPADSELELVEAWHNTNAWHREQAGDTATTKSAWRYHFRVVRKEMPVAARLPLTEIHEYVSRITMEHKVFPVRTETAEVVCLADAQIGKRDERGGTPDLERRFYGAMEEVLDRIRESKPDEIVLAELGDGCENFQNVASQAHTNDRNLIAQLDLHATFLTYAAVELSKLAGKLTVVGVPSNHMEMRNGSGKAIGGPDNDYGLLTLSQLKRAFGLNPSAFRHVEFAWPSEFDVSKVLNVAGHNVMFTHGHYARGAGAANSVPGWLEKQFAASTEAHAAEYIFTGHYHHLRIQQVIGGRWWFQAPALDNGSAWLKRVNGEGASDAGILTVRLTRQGWDGAEILGNRIAALPSPILRAA